MRVLSEEERSTVFRLLERLRQGVVLVEGQRDVEVLKRLGVRAIPVASRRVETLFSLVKGKVVFILTDNDRRGNALAKRLKTELEPFAVCDLNTRRTLLSTLKLNRVEELNNVYEVMLWERRILTP
jgi:5S rRNA maturation endonuclease (ribonuclease M5)